MVEVRLDEHVVVSYRPGDDSAVEVTVSRDGERVARYETNSRPWDEGLVQVRNVAARHLDGYSRADLLERLEASVPDHEQELRALFE